MPDDAIPPQPEDPTEGPNPQRLPEWYCSTCGRDSYKPGFPTPSPAGPPCSQCGVPLPGVEPVGPPQPPPQ